MKRLLSWIITCSFTIMVSPLAHAQTCPEGTAYFSTLTTPYGFRTTTGEDIILASITMNAETIRAFPQLPQQVRARMMELLEVNPLTIHPSPSLDGSCRAQVMNANGDWIQEILIKEGLGYASHRPSADAYLPTLIQAEDAATDAQLGMWASRDTVIHDAVEINNPAYANSYRMVEGRIGYVRDRNRVILTCLHEDPWRSVCLLVLRDTYNNMRENGFDLMEAEGTEIRARGDLFFREGLKMFIDRPELIEVQQTG